MDIGSGTATNSHPTVATGLPEKLNAAPAGLFTRKLPFVLVPNIVSALDPRSTGRNVPMPRPFSYVAVAPVPPPLLSNVMPAQNFCGNARAAMVAL